MSFPRAAMNGLILGAATSKVQGRCWPNKHFPAKGATLPRVSWQRTNTQNFGTFDGPGPSLSEVEITCEAETEDEVQKLADVIEEALDGYRSDGPIHGVDFPGEGDDPEPPQEGAEQGFSRIRLRAMVAH